MGLGVVAGGDGSPLVFLVTAVSSHASNPRVWGLREASHLVPSGGIISSRSGGVVCYCCFLIVSMLRITVSWVFWRLSMVRRVPSISAGVSVSWAISSTVSGSAMMS